MKRSTAENFIITAAIAAVLLVALGVLAGVWQHVYAQPTTPAPVQVSRIGPDISHCFNDDETRELWDCIRYMHVTGE